jgi:hypothetical protein
MGLRCGMTLRGCGRIAGVIPPGDDSRGTQPGAECLERSTSGLRLRGLVWSSPVGAGLRLDQRAETQPGAAGLRLSSRIVRGLRHRAGAGSPAPSNCA